jgi:hypothetical protein
MQQIAYRERVGWSWPLQELFTEKTAKSMAVISKYLEPIIHQALERKKTCGRQSEEPDEESTLRDELQKTSGEYKFSTTSSRLH